MRCKLCDNEAHLRGSHILPKFVFKWLKSTGGEYIRKPDNPNIRHQDGLKEYLLCDSCEQLFSKYEGEFAKRIFHPHVNNGLKHFKYDEFLFKFSISVLWRILVYGIKEHREEKRDHLLELDNAELEWKGFLINDQFPLSYCRIHVFFTDNELKSGVQPVNGFVNYYLRAADGAIAFSDKVCLVYAKIARVIIIGEIKNVEEMQMVNTLISPISGELSVNSMKLSDEIKKFLVSRASQVFESLANISDNQKKTAIEYGEKVMKELRNKDIGKIIEMESEMIIDPDYFDF